MSKWMLIVAVVTFALMESASNAAGKEQSDSGSIFPLNKIWAWDMPGTADIRKLEPNLLEKVTGEEQQRRASRSLISQTLQPLAKFPAAQSKPGFAVKGNGIDALKNAHAVLANSEKPTKAFSTHDDVSVVFFSRLLGAYVHLKEVKRAAHCVEIRYQFVPHLDSEQTINFALIPLGKMPVGRVEVKIIRLPQDKKFDVMNIAPVSQEMESRAICKSFQFVVEDKQ